VSQNPIHPRLQSLLETLEADPTDTPAFRTLEEELFVGGNWSQLAIVYECRLEGLPDDDDRRPDLTLRLADMLRERLGKPAKARPYYERLLQADPSGPGALAGLRRVHVELGNLTGALQIAELEEQLELPRARKGPILAEIGELWRLLGDAGEARRHFDEAMQLTPDCDRALAGLAGLATDSGDTATAIALHEQRLQGLRGTARSNAMEELAGLLPDSDADRARSLLRDVVFADPGRLSAMRSLLELERKADNAERVEELSDSIWAVSKDDGERRALAIGTASQLLEGDADLDGAWRWLQRGLAIAPDDVDLLQLRARLCRRRKEPDALIQTLERLDELEEPDTMRKLEIAVLHESADRPQEAVRHLRELVARSPEEPEALEALDRCLERTGDPASRVEVLERRLASSAEGEDCAALWKELGDLQLDRLDAPAEAEAAYRHALTCHPGMADAAERLVELLRKGERFDEVASLMQQAADAATAGPERALRLCELAEFTLGTLGELAGAHELFSRALETDPACSTALAGLRTVAERGGGSEALFEACERELAANPSDERRGQLLRDLFAAARLEDDPARAQSVAERWASLEASPEAFGALVELARERGDTQAETAALESLEALLHDQPETRAGCLDRLGDLAIASEDTAGQDRAVRWWQEAVAAQSASPARGKLIALCRHTGRLPELAEHLRVAIADGPEPEALGAMQVELTRVLAKLGDFAGATDALRPAFDRAPENRGIADLLESLLSEQDRIEDLTDVLGRRLECERDPGQRRELAHRCAGLLLDGLARPADAVSTLHELADPSRHDGLEQLFERALEAAGGAVRAERQTWLSTREPYVDESVRLDLLLCLAKLQQESGQLDQAIDSLRRAERLAKAGELEVVHRSLLTLVREQGDPEEQLRLLSRLLDDSEDPSTQAAVRIEQARIQIDALDQPEQALGDLAQLDVGTLAATELRLLAGLYARANAPERRVATLEALAEAVPDLEEQLQVWLELTELLADGPDELRDEARAETCLRDLLERYPDDPRLFDRLGTLYERAGKGRERADLIRLRLAGDEVPGPERTSLSLQLSRLLQDLDEPGEAVEVLENGRKLARAEEAASPALDAALLHALECAGDGARRCGLCEEMASETTGADRARWLERWLDALESQGAGAEPRLAVVEQLLHTEGVSPSLRILRVSLLRALDRSADLATAIEDLLAADATLSTGRRRGLVRELLRACDGELGDPARALALIEREVTDDPELAVPGAQLAAKLGDPDREAALLAPRVAAMQDEARPAEIRQLALAHVARRCPGDAEPLLQRALETHPRDRQVLAALESILRQRNDAEGVLKLLATHFQLEDADRRIEIAREGEKLSAELGDAHGELRWLRRRHALETLKPAACQRWLELERSEGDDAGVLQALTELREQAPNGPEQAALLAAEADTRLTFGQLDLARAQYEQAIADVDDPPVAWLEALDGILDAQGRTVERAGLLRELSQHPGLSPRERVRHQEANVALLAAHPQQREQAAAELRALLDLDSDTNKSTSRRTQLLALYDGLQWPLAWCELAESLLPSLEAGEAEKLEREIARRLGQELRSPLAAAERWRHILERDPDDLEALAALAELLDAPGHESERADALELYAAAGALDAGEVWLEAARVRWQVLRDSEAALQDLDAALAGRDNLAEAHELRRELCEQIADAPREIESLRALLEMHPNARHSDDRWLRLAELLLDHPRSDAESTRDEAAQAGAAALAVHADPDAALRTRVRRVFERSGNWDGAAELLQVEIDAAEDDDRPALLRRLARVDWDELQRAERACRTFAALSDADVLDPDEEDRWADALGALERWPEALSARERALDLRGAAEGPAAWLELARAQVENANDPEAAIRACGHALELDSALSDALELRADLHQRLGRHADELEDRARLGELHGDAVSAADAIARAACIARDDLGDATRAGGLFRSALQRDASNVNALEGAGTIALERSEWEEAERLLGMAAPLLDDQPERGAEAARGAAEAAFQQSRYADAFHHLEKALDHDPAHPPTLDRMAEIALRLGAHERARTCLETRLEQKGLSNSERAERMSKLALASEGTGDREGAAELLECAIELHPSDEVTRARAVDLLEDLGEWDRALKQIGAWLDTTAEEFRPALELRAARLELRAGRRAEARTRLEALVENDTVTTEAWAELGRLQLDDDDASGALTLAERGLGRLGDGERGPLLWVKASALHALDRIPDASRAARDSLREDPTNVDAARLLARHLGQAGEFGAAVTELERVLDTGHPEPSVEAEIWEAIGRAYAGPLEDVERAQRAYRRALEANPRRTGAREALADITAFDPASHQESVQLHRELLEALPARPGSWKALARIADHWERTAPSRTCAVVLESLATPRPDAEGADGATPLLREGPAWGAAVQAGLDLLRAREDAELLPGGPRRPDTGESPALRAQLLQIAGSSWSLSNAKIQEVWRRPVDEAALTIEGAPRRARKKLRKALRAFDPAPLRQLEVEAWREAMLCEAAAGAVVSHELTLRDALLDLLDAWPATQRLDLRGGGDLGAAVQLCAPARALLLRIADATLSGLGL